MFTRRDITSGMTAVISMFGRTASTRLSGAVSTSCLNGGPSKRVVIISMTDAGKGTTRVSDHQYNPPIEKAPLVGAFLCVLPGYQGVRQPSQSRASPSPGPQPNHLRRSGPHSDLDCPGVA